MSSDRVIIWGGADISPKIYGQDKLSYTKVDIYQDEIDTNTIELAIKDKIPIIGVCRGAQLLCAMTGGQLYQHISPRQTGIITMECFDGSLYKTVVDHHQVMIPNMKEATVLAIQQLPKTAQAYITETKTKELTAIPEIIYYKSINALAIQPHPEWPGQGEGFLLWLNALIKNLLGVKDDTFTPHPF